jgi:hypothetical protein
VNKFFLLHVGLFFFSFAAFCQTGNLAIAPEDLRVVPEYSNDRMAGNSVTAITGYHLFVRKKPGMESVMLTETTRDPSAVEANYAFRALAWNAVNGDEIRRLNGEVLASEYAKYSIIDSTPESDGQFGSAFHLYIPQEMAYGYPWTRNGVTKIGQGTFINIRAFGALYGDYTNGYQDNPYMFDFVITQEPPPPPPVGEIPANLAINSPDAPLPAPGTPETPPPKPTLTDSYNKDAAAAFSDISSFNKGIVTHSHGPYQLVNEIIQSIDQIEDKTRADVVLAIDTTGSMKDAFSQIRRELVSRLQEESRAFGSIRIGLLFYRDYADNYRFEGFPVKLFPFTAKMEDLTSELESVTIVGSEGGDIPEAVYEALYVSMDFYAWDAAAEQKIILIGDAEPHPKPRGLRKYSRELIQEFTQARDITIDTILMPVIRGVSVQ